MPEPKDVLALIGDEELPATTISRRLDVHLDRLYPVLVGMEARGEAQVVLSYDRGHRTACYWRAA